MNSRYQDHIKVLARELQVEVRQKPHMSGMMYVEFGYVECPTITNQIEYLTNLHELGHCAFGHTQGRPPHSDKRYYFDNGVLRSEAEAWEWALNRCIDPIQDASRRFMWDTCLGSYYEVGYLSAKGQPFRLRNGNRHHIEFVFDHPDAFFDGMVKRIQGHLTDYEIAYRGKMEFSG